MNPHKLRRAQLVDFGDNAVTILTAGGAGDVDPAVQTAQAAILSPLVTALGTDEQAAVDTLAAYRAAVQDADLQRQLALIGIQNVKNTLRGAGCAPSVFAAVGYDAPVTSPVIYIPNDPTECAALGYSQGYIDITFKGNNPAGYVIYELWRLEGDTNPWHLQAISGKQKFRDQPVVPGEYYNYKVRANAARHLSDFSNTAVVYGP